MSLTIALILLTVGQSGQPAPTSVPDVLITGPRPDQVYCLRNAPRAGSRVRRTDCRSHEEWVELAAARQDQADNLFRRGGRGLTDSELVEALAHGRAAALARRRAARAAPGG